MPGAPREQGQGRPTAKKPKAAKNIKVTGQTPAPGSGAVSASTGKGKH